MPRDYDTLFPAEDAGMLRDMDEAVTEADMWDWLKTFEPEKGKGFMFTEHPNVMKISSNTKYGGHSGSSFAWCMRNMQGVAKYGWDKYRADILEVRLKKANESLDKIIEAFASSSDPNKKNQAEVMKNFKSGSISYAQMREHCG